MTVETKKKKYSHCQVLKNDNCQYEDKEDSDNGVMKIL